MREGGAEYRMQDPEVGRAEHTQVFRLEKKHKGGVSRERATEYRERVMKWQNPRIHDCSLHLQNGIDHHSGIGLDHGTGLDHGGGSTQARWIEPLAWTGPFRVG